MDIEKLRNAFTRNRYAFSFFESRTEAAAYLDAAVDGKTVGLGDSETLLSLGLYGLLSKHNIVHDPQNRVEGKTFLQTGADCLTTQIFFTSVNAATETGLLVNLDGTGNRVAGSLFGHEKVYFVFGTNKITPDLESAVDRVRNVAAPKNAARHGYTTPCAAKGDRCYDCASPERICNALVVHYKAMKNTQMEVVLIHESLGL